MRCDDSNGSTEFIENFENKEEPGLLLHTFQNQISTWSNSEPHINRSKVNSDNTQKKTKIIASKMREKEAGKRPQQQLSYPRGPPPFPPPCCPRCSSGNTKFCYYNNYSASQPRYICKECHRYWTHGGVVRNIPSTRKRGRVDSSSSSAHISKPPPSGLPAAWSMGSSSHNAAGVGSRSGVGCDTFRPPVTKSMQPFNVGGVYYQPTLNYSPGGELGGLKFAFGAVSAGLSGAAPLTPMLPHPSPLDGFNDFGYSFLQQPQFQPPPTLWTSQNTGLNSSSSQQHGSWKPTAAANVVSIHEWPELNDMDTEGDPLQSYKPPSP